MRAGRRSGGRDWTGSRSPSRWSRPTARTRCCRRSTKRSRVSRQLDPEQARIIELRYFVGLSVEDAAAALLRSRRLRSSAALRWRARGCSASSRAARRDAGAVAARPRPLRAGDRAASVADAERAGSPVRTGDRALRPRCCPCLNHHTRAGAFLEAGSRSAWRDLLIRRRRGSEPGDAIGPYLDQDGDRPRRHGSRVPARPTRGSAATSR